MEFLDKNKITGYQKIILLMCLFCVMLDGFDIIIISYTAPSISRDLEISHQQLGLVFSSGFVGMALGAMLVPMIASIYGPRMVICGFLLIVGIATGLVFFTQTIPYLAILRLITGMGLGGLVAVVPAFAAEFSPLNYRTFILSGILSGTSVGSALGGLISAIVIPEYGWRVLYLITGLLLILTGVLFRWLMPESIYFRINQKGDSSLADINELLLKMGHEAIEKLPDIPKDQPGLKSVIGLLDPLRRSNTLLCWAGFFLGYGAIYFLTSWLPKILVDSGFPEQQSMQSMVILTIGSLFGAMSIGWVSRRRQLNCFLSISFFCASALTVLLALVISLQFHQVYILFLIAFLVGFSLHGAFANFYALGLSVYPPHLKITGIGWCYGLGRCGAIVSPAFAGYLLGTGTTINQLLVLCSLIIAVKALLIVFIKPKESY